MDVGQQRDGPKRLACPTCGTSFSPQDTSAMPFCSLRCKQIDLGRWFNEEIGLPVEHGNDEPQDRDDLTN